MSGIPGIGTRHAGVHGVIAVPALNRVYASATDDHEALTIDATTGKVLAHAPAGDYPDGLAYAPPSHSVFVSDESGGVETVLDADGKRIATIDLGGAAGNVQYDRGSRRILADVQTRNEIAVIDPVSNRVVKRIQLAGCDTSQGEMSRASQRTAMPRTTPNLWNRCQTAVHCFTPQPTGSVTAARLVIQEPSRAHHPQ